MFQLDCAQIAGKRRLLGVSEGGGRGSGRDPFVGGWAERSRCSSSVQAGSVRSVEGLSGTKWQRECVFAFRA